MKVLLFAMVLLPLLAQPADDGRLEQARLSTGLMISEAVDAARSFEPPVWVAAAREELAEYPEYADVVISAIYSASAETGLDPEMIWSVMYTESHGRHFRRNGSVKRGGAGEIGLMQVLPWWERGLKKEYDIDVDLWDVTDNIRAGAYILRRGGDEPRVMLSYYNTGLRVSSTPYQRKVMRYWDKLGDVT